MAYMNDRMQTIHTFFNLRVDHQESRHIRYYFGGSIHFFIWEPGDGNRYLSIDYCSKEQAMMYYNLWPKGIRWKQVVRIQSD